MDFLDLINPREEYYFTGYYYDTIPPKQNDGKKVFNYRQINPYSKTFALVVGAIQDDEEVTAIKTQDNLDWRIKGYVSTQNGQMYIIDQIIVDEQVRGYEEAVRISKKSTITVYNLRLVRVDNPWGIGT